MKLEYEPLKFLLYTFKEKEIEENPEEEEKLCNKFFTWSPYCCLSLVWANSRRLDLVQAEGWLGRSRFVGGAEGVVLLFLISLGSLFLLSVLGLLFLICLLRLCWIASTSFNLRLLFCVLSSLKLFEFFVFFALLFFEFCSLWKLSL